MNLAQVEAFLILADELHFGRTAERLALSQPRVSRLMAALEREVGGVLFERTSRRVRLTPLGIRLRAGWQPAFTQIHAALDDSRAVARQPAGVLRIGFTNTTDGDAQTSPPGRPLITATGRWPSPAGTRSPTEGRCPQRTSPTMRWSGPTQCPRRSSTRSSRPTVIPLPLAQRSDIALVPIRDLPALLVGLIWCTAHENGRIRTIAEVAATHFTCAFSELCHRP